MSPLRPIELSVHLLTMRGYVMQHELVSALRQLCCTSDQCVLQVSEILEDEALTQTSFEVCLYCRRALQAAEPPWTVESHHDEYPEHTLYRARFNDSWSVPEIVEAIRAILDTPLVQIQH
jgi:hypothetical protein